MRRAPCLIVLAMLVMPLDASPSTNLQPMLQEAVESYDSAFETDDRNERVRLFRRSEILFRQIAEQSDSPSAELLVNLGNAALGAERIGPAILAFRKALEAQPKHRRARQNIEHARTLLPGWVPQPDDSASGIDSFFSTANIESDDDLYQLAAIAFLVAMGFLAVSIWLRRVGFRNIAVVLFLVWMVLLGSAVWRSQDTTSDIAVVVAPDTVARSADSMKSPARFPEPLPSGAEVEIMEQRQQWIRVRLFDGRDAWLPASSVQRVEASYKSRTG